MSISRLASVVAAAGVTAAAVALAVAAVPPAADRDDAGGTLGIPTSHAIHADRRAFSPRRWAALRRHAVQAAESFLDHSRRHALETDRYVIVSDVPNERKLDAFVATAESLHEVLDEISGGALSAAPAREPLLIYVYRTHAEYTRLTETILGHQWTAGFYTPLGLLAFHLEHPTTAQVQSVQMHEMTHALLDRELVRPGVSIPVWLTEGLAEYIGNSDVRRGELIPGSHRRHAVWIYDDRQGRMAPARARWALTAARARLAVQRGRGLTIDDLIHADEAEFYGELRSLYYTQAWILVHFLRHGDPSWAETAFPALLRAISAGRTPEQAFARAYGAPISAFERRYADYVRRFRR